MLIDALSGLWETRGDATLKVCDYLWGRVPVEGGVGCHASCQDFGLTSRMNRRLTPRGGVGIVDGGVDVAEVDFAHEAIDLRTDGGKHGRKGQEARSTED